MVKTVDVVKNNISAIRVYAFKISEKIAFISGYAQNYSGNPLEANAILFTLGITLPFNITILCAGEAAGVTREIIIHTDGTVTYNGVLKAAYIYFSAVIPIS